MIKFLLIFFYLFATLLFSPFIYFFYRALRIKVIKKWSLLILKILNINLSTNINLYDVLKDNRFLIVSNHVSWLDIIVLNAMHPVSFVAKRDIKHWPFINLLCAISETIFIDRSSPAKVKKVIVQVSENLAQKNVCIFPEGTSTDGFDVLPFKSNLFESAIMANVSILPIAISYYIDNKKTAACSYYGDMSILESLISILKLNRITVKIEVLNRIKSNRERKILSSLAYQMIRSEVTREIR